METLRAIGTPMAISEPQAGILVLKTLATG
jgi:hypothetical protein